MGRQPVRRDITTVQGVSGVEDVTPITSLALYGPAGAIAAEDIRGAGITVVGYNADGDKVTGVLTPDPTASTIEFGEGIVWIDSIVGTNLPFNISIRTDIADSDTCLAVVLRGTDVVRYRRYKVGGYLADTYVHIVGKRAWSTVAAEDDIIHMGNVSVWKHAMLAKVAEDNGDVEHRAGYHWAQCLELLNEDLHDYCGAAQPHLSLDIWGGACPGPYGGIQSQF